jgi:Fe-S cluster assembly protein SufD
MNAPVTNLKTAAETELSKLYADSRPAGAGALRDEAFRRVDASGLPHRRIEAWHYTDLRALMKSALPLAAAPSAELAARRPWSVIAGDHVISFVDGHCTKLPKLPKGVTVRRLSELFDDGAALAARLNKAVDLSGDAVTSLNTAFMADGVVIDVAAGTVVTVPLSLAFETTGATASYTRVLFTLGEGAELTLIETHRGAASQENTVMEAVVAKGAKLDHVRVNAANVAAQTLSTVAASVAENASFSTLSFTTGAALSRHQVFLRVHGDHAKVGVRGVTLLKGTQHADTTLVTEHAALHGEGRKLFKNVIDGEARGVFQGKIIVKPHAQKTDGKMSCNALLLGENAQMHAKPELEIFADDVVCGHGATVGALDDDLLFYLMSRGIGRKEAEGLMIQAFAGEALEAIEHEDLREALVALTAEWIAGRASR